MRLRLRTVLRQRIVAVTDYSGLDTPREAMHAAIIGLQRKFAWPEADVKNVVFKRTCDCGTSQTRLLTWISNHCFGSRVCHFENLFDRLPTWGKEWLAAALPPKNASKAVRSAAHQDIDEWMHRCKDALFTPEQKSMCSVHGRMCPVHPKYDVAMPQPPAKRSRDEQGTEHHPEEIPEDSEDIPEEQSDDERDEPVYINVAGVTCLAWSGEGAQEQHAHFSEVPHSLWCAERSAWASRKDEGLFFSECTPKYPVETKLMDRLPHHEVLSIRTAPEFFGWPSRRKRLLMCGIVKSQFVWAGPTDYEEDFARRFYKGMSVQGDVFFRASRAERDEEYTEIARARKFQVSSEHLKSMRAQAVLEMILPPGALVRAFTHNGNRETLAADEVLIVDVDHNVGSKGSTPGSEWPVQLTHGTFMNITEDIADMQVAVAREHLLAMGFNMYPPEGSLLPPSPLVTALSACSMSRSEIKRLGGNSMHMVTQAAWMMYVLSNLIRREVPRVTAQTARRLATFDCLDDEEDLA